MIAVSVEKGTTNNVAIVVRTAFGLDTCSIEFIQALEQGLDEALYPLGFSRKISTVAGDHLEWAYYQSAVFLGDAPKAHTS